jgi:hypothetical protein
VPALRESLVQRYRDALAGTWSAREVLALFDAYAEEVADAARRGATNARGVLACARTIGAAARMRSRVSRGARVRRTWIAERWEVIGEEYR